MHPRQRLFVALPDAWQRRLIVLLGRLGLLDAVPVFRMFARTLEFAGARPGDLRRALRTRGGFARLAADSAADGARLRVTGEHARAAAAYHRAAIYAISDCWGIHDLELRKQRYAPVLEYVDRYVELAHPRIERLVIDAGASSVPALFRRPDGACRGALIMFPGSDQTKEWMAPFETFALERGLATLAIDLPGLGQNAFGGDHLDSLDKLGVICRALAADLHGRLGAQTPIGTFGVSLGGLFAIAASGYEPSIRVSAGLGSPVRMGRGLRHIAAAQREVMLAWSGAGSIEELRRRFDPERVTALLRSGRASCLIVHGLADEVVPSADARALADLLGARADLRLLPDNDHMCTQALAAGAARGWFDWIAARLAKVRLAEAGRARTRAS